jgi:DNA polymerase V
MGKSSKKDFRFGIDSGANGLDLNELLVEHPSSTFYMRLENDAKHLELNAGDILQVDRSLKPKVNDIAVVTEASDAEIKVVRWQDSPKSSQLWGVVASVIRKLRT